jgi:creatinine amidohydrolase
MELRTRILPKMLNCEVEEYLQENDLIIVPVGTVEMHGGLPLDCETVTSEAFALKMAEEANALVLTGLPYFYAGATASGRGTVQCSVREGIDYLGAIARSLLRQGFKRQIYISFHGPAHMTCSPMIRDFFDETGVPILYLDLCIQLFSAKQLLTSMQNINSIFVGAYQIMQKLDEVPLTTEHAYANPQTVAPFNDLFGMAYQSGAVGYCFGSPCDHAPTPVIDSIEARSALANEGEHIITELVKSMDVPHLAQQIAKLAAFENDVMQRCPWMPAAWNREHKK